MKLSEIIGFNPPRKLVKGKNAPFVEMAALPQNSRDISYVFQKEFNGSGTKFKNGDTLLARITPCLENGKTAKVNCLHANEIAHGSTEFIVMQAKEPEFDEDFIYYLCRWNNFREYAVGRMEGSSGRQRVDWRAVSDFECNLPDKEIRKKIGYSLKQFDDKIATNNKINQTLESISQTLFKSWFVDFDPVKAKIAAKEQGDDPQLAAMMAISGKSEDEINQMPADKRKQLVETADLFPDEMMDSELGEIPKGWKVELLYDTINIIGGGTPDRKNDKYWNGDIPWFSVKDSPSQSNVFVLETAEKITEQGLQNSSTKIVDVGTTIITARGTVGQMALVGCPMAFNQSCYGIVGKKFGQYLNYYNLKNAVAALLQNTHGAVFDTITTNTFKTVNCVVPSDKLIIKYEKSVNHLLERIKMNNRETISLSSLRDTLLPQLLSGELLNTE